jgi:hypothetical protein
MGARFDGHGQIVDIPELVAAQKAPMLLVIQGVLPGLVRGPLYARSQSMYFGS